MIELKITASDASEFQTELAGLKAILWPQVLTSGSVSTRQPVKTELSSSSTPPLSGEDVSTPNTTTAPETEASEASTNDSSPGQEQPKRRGRPKKTDNTGPSALGDAEQGNEPASGATEAEEQKSDDVSAMFSADEEGNESSSSSETQTDQGSESPEPVSDSDLQKFSARLAAHYGTGQKVFDLAASFVDGGVPRPSNIKGDAARWEFIRAAEADTGLKYHG